MGSALSSPDKVGVNAAKQAREFHPPEAKYDWRGGRSAGAQILSKYFKDKIRGWVAPSRAPTRVGTGPDKVGVNATK